MAKLQQRDWIESRDDLKSKACLSKVGIGMTTWQHIFIPGQRLKEIWFCKFCSHAASKTRVNRQSIVAVSLPESESLLEHEQRLSGAQ